LTWANFPIEDSTKSPCIDAGDPASPEDPDSTVADMGALYFDQPQGTYVPSGSVSGTWTQDESPYLVYGDITVQTGTRSGDSLVIEPGVEIVFLGHHKLNVYGRLLAVGTRTDSILFTALDTVEGWWGLRFLDSNTNGQDSSKVIYCRLEYGRATGSGTDDDGGGMFFYQSSDILVRNCIITKNTAEGYGGGIACHNSSGPRIEATAITGNRAETLGGGISCYSHSSPQIVDVTLANNVAAGYYGTGGGFSAYDQCVPTLTRVLVSENYTDYDAGGIYIDGSEVILDRVTMVDNATDGSGGGILLYNCEAFLTNCIVRGNSPDQVLDISAYVDLTYSNVENGWGGTGNIDLDPLFADPENGDYRLTWDSYPVEDSTKSSCIDSGDPGSSLDPDGTRADMGAFYFNQWIPDLISPSDSSLISDDTPLFGWTSTAGEGGFYVLQCATDTAFQDLVIHAYGVEETTYVHGSALDDTTYYWHVEAVDSTGAHSGYPLHPFTFTLDSEAPEIPVLLTPGDSSKVEVNPPTFTWTAVAVVTGGERISTGAIRSADPRGHGIKRASVDGTEVSKTSDESTGAKGSDREAPRSGSAVTYTFQCATDSGFTDLVIDSSGLVGTAFTPPDTFVQGTYFWHVDAVDEAGHHSGYQPHPFRFEVQVELCGDANGDGNVTAADGFTILNYFGAGPQPVSCFAANVNGDSGLTTADGFHLLNYLGAGPALDCAPCEF
jgi:hypothetical protein